MPGTKPQMPTIRDFRPFIICTPETYEATKSFYADLGFQKLWDDGGSACEFATGFDAQRFLLTLHHNIEPPQNAMLQFWVEDTQAWYEYMKGLKLDEHHPSITITEPEVTPWGWLITYVADPAGVKLHFAQPHTEDNKRFFNDAGWMK